MGCARSNPADRKSVLTKDNGIVGNSETGAETATLFVDEGKDPETQLTASHLRSKRLCFAFEANDRFAHMAIGMASELEDNGWGVSLVGQYIRNPEKLKLLINDCDAFIFFGESADSLESTSEHHHRLDSFSMENQLKLAKEQGIKMIHLVTGSGQPSHSVSEVDLIKVGFHSRGVERSKMWRTIFDFLEDRHTVASKDSAHFLSRTSSWAAINKSSSFVSRDTLSLKPTDGAFQAVYIVAPSVRFGPDARELCAKLRLRGIFARMITERDDVNVLASNNEAYLGLFMRETLFLEEPVAVRAVRAFSKRKRGSNRIICFQLSGSSATWTSNVSDEGSKGPNNNNTPRKSPSSNGIGATFTDRVLSAAKQRGLTSFEFQPVGTISSSPLSSRDSQMIMNKLVSTLASLPSCYRLLPPNWMPQHLPLFLSKQSRAPRALLARLDAVIQDESFQLIEYVGGPVTGKSTTLAHYCIDHNPALMDLAYMTKNDASPVVVGAFHFFQHREGRLDSLRLAIVGIYAQLCGTLKGFSSPWDVAEIVDNFDHHESDLCAFFYELIGETIRIGPNVESYAREGKRIVIVLDGCDECDRIHDLLRILAKWPTFAPKWLVLVVSFTNDRFHRQLERVDEGTNHHHNKNNVFVFRESQEDLREKCLDGLLQGYGLKDHERIPAGTHKSIESKLMKISNICGKLVTKAQTDALFARLHLNEDAILDFILDSVAKSDGELDEEKWLSSKCSSLSNVYEDVLRSWFESEFDSSEENFQLALRTALILPRQAIPERIWRDLEFAENVPHFLSAFPSLGRHCLRFPFKSMFDFVFQTNLVLETNTTKLKDEGGITIELWNEKAHGLLANVLMKEKWLNQQQQQQREDPYDNMFLTAQGRNSNGGANFEGQKTESMDEEDDDDVEKEENKVTPPTTTTTSESVLKVAADVRRSYLGSISQEVDQVFRQQDLIAFSSGAGETTVGGGGMKRYRRVARRPTFIEYEANDNEPAESPGVSKNEDMSILLFPHKQGEEEHDFENNKQRKELVQANQEVDIQACEEEEFAIENCAFHLFWAISNETRARYCRPSLFRSQWTKQEWEQVAKSSFSPWLERYLHWWTNVDVFMKRIQISFEQSSYSTRLVSDALLGGPMSELLAEMLVRSRKALRVDVHQLCGQILGRINPTLESESLEATRLVEAASHWLNEHEMDFSAIALPFRHFSGLYPVGSSLRRSFQHPFAVYALKLVSIGNDQTLALTASWDGLVRVFDLNSGRMIKAQQISRHPLLALDIFPVEFGENHVSELICGTADGQILYLPHFHLFLNNDDEKEEENAAPPLVVEMRLNNQRINCVQWMPTNEVEGVDTKRKVVSGSEDGSCIIWTVQQINHPMRVLFEPKRGSSVICLLATQEILFTGGSDRTIKVIEIETGQVIANLSGHGGEIRSLSFDAESNALCSGSADKTIRVWDCQTWRCVRIIQQIHFSSINSLDFHFPLILSISDQIRVYNLLEDRVIQTWRCDGHTGSVGGFLLNPNASQQQQKPKLVGAWAVAEDNIARFWTSEFQYDEEERDSKHDLAVTGVSVDMEGTLACSSSLDRTCKIWNLETGKCTLQLDGHHDSVYCCSLSRDGRFCATGSLDKTCRVWDLLNKTTTGALLRSFAHQDVVFSVFLSDVDEESNEHLVVTGSTDGARVFSIESGEIRADSFVKQSLFDVPIQAATDASNIWTDLTVKGADSKAVGFTPDAQADDLKRVGRFVYGPVGNSFAIWKLY